MSDAIKLDATPNKVTVTNKGNVPLSVNGNVSITTLDGGKSVDISPGIDKTEFSVGGALVATVFNDSQHNTVDVIGGAHIPGTGPITVLATITTV
ncbi:hypothetical protein C8R44DRAFT_865261 [Mycena epipterygia]|nr:hypothetical protein C8R44DRAFT_865261 [Mycena epipterygia]